MSDASIDAAVIDSAGIERWFGALGIGVAGRLRFDRIGLGQSNLTYLVSDESEGRWVLRRPPLGHLLASAHDVVREARIMAALADTDVPAPRILGVAQDDAVSDVPLVLMEFIDGQVVDTMAIAESLTPQRRRAISDSMPRTLAKIHAVDLDRVGLADLASHKPYAQRQLKRWAGQWEQSKTRELRTSTTSPDGSSPPCRSRRDLPRARRLPPAQRDRSARTGTAVLLSGCWTGNCRRSVIRSRT